MINKLLLLIALISLFSCNVKNSNEKSEFNSKVWLDGDRRIRGKMVDNIIDDSILIGKNKADVLNILGDPTASDTLGSLSYVVDIGLKSGPFGIGGTWLFFLTVKFDTINKVDEVSCRD